MFSQRISRQTARVASFSKNTIWSLSAAMTGSTGCSGNVTHDGSGAVLAPGSESHLAGIGRDIAVKMHRVDEEVISDRCRDLDPRIRVGLGQSAFDPKRHPVLVLIPSKNRTRPGCIVGGVVKLVAA